MLRLFLGGCFCTTPVKLGANNDQQCWQCKANKCSRDVGRSTDLCHEHISCFQELETLQAVDCLIFRPIRDNICCCFSFYRVRTSFLLLFVPPNMFWLGLFADQIGVKKNESLTLRTPSQVPQMLNEAGVRASVRKKERERSLSSSLRSCCHNVARQSQIQEEGLCALFPWLTLPEVTVPLNSDNEASPPPSSPPSSPLCRP